MGLADIQRLPAFWSRAWEKLLTPEDALPGDDYRSLELENLASDPEVPFGVYLKTGGAGSSPPAYAPCCGPREVFPQALYDKLRLRNLAQVYFHSGDQESVLAFLHRNLGLLISDQTASEALKVARLQEITLLSLQDFFQAKGRRVGQRVNLGLQPLANLLNLLLQDPFSQKCLLELCAHDVRLYSHSLNTALLGLAFTHFLGWSPLRLRDFGFGALLHDIGMTRISTNILNKPTQLSDEERELVKRHPMAGFALLKTSPAISRDTLLTVLQHHEHGDGSGYPEGLNLKQIAPPGRVMGIIDSYEALTSPRSWRPQFEPAQALWTMRQEWQENSIFDANYLSAFIKFIVSD